MKNVMVHFDFPSLTQQQYDAVWNDLNAQGYSHPQGLLFHVGAPNPNGGFLVTDVWESRDAWNKFTQTLMPIIQKNAPNVTGQPIVTEASYVYQPAEMHV
jgi:hypothetical protein